MRRRRRPIDRGPLPYRRGKTRKFEKAIKVLINTGEVITKRNEETQMVGIIYQISAETDDTYYIATTELYKKTNVKQLDLFKQ